MLGGRDGDIELIHVENKTPGIILRILNLMALADG
jgi:hypothetical protein